MSKKSLFLSWFFQILIVVILAPTAIAKLRGNETTTLIFERLGMGETGMILIGVIELIASALLLVPLLSHLGSILALGVMLGAILAHISVLGLKVNDDGGMLVVFLSLIIISSTAILYIHRKRLPFVGVIFDDKGP